MKLKKALIGLTAAAMLAASCVAAPTFGVQTMDGSQNAAEIELRYVVSNIYSINVPATIELESIQENEKDILQIKDTALPAVSILKKGTVIKDGKKLQILVKDAYIQAGTFTSESVFTNDSSAPIDMEVYKVTNEGTSQLMKIEPGSAILESVKENITDLPSGVTAHEQTFQLKSALVQEDGTTVSKVDPTKDYKGSLKFEVAIVDRT